MCKSVSWWQPLPYAPQKFLMSCFMSPHQAASQPSPDLMVLKCTQSQSPPMYVGSGESHSVSSHFQAFPSWVYWFKQQFKICPRWITKLVSQRSHTNRKIAEKKNMFLKWWERRFTRNMPHLKFLMQINVVWTMRPRTRTVSCIGEKDTKVVAISKTTITHSYSVLPLISLDGNCFKRGKSIFADCTCRSLFTLGTCGMWLARPGIIVITTNF